MPRRYPIFQFPNPPLVTALLAGAVARVTHGSTARGAAVISALAQLVWAYEEITDGANGFRRLLGIVGAARAGAELMRTANPASPPFLNQA
jgi:hypothetical protein